MSERGNEPATLSRVVEEVGETDPPDVDWDRMEQALLEATEKPSEPKYAISTQSRRPYFALAAAAAMAIGVGAFWKLGATTTSVSELAEGPRVVAPTTTGVVDGDALSVGDRVVARGSSVTVKHSGRVQWTLSAGSEAKVVVGGELLTVDLTSGKLLAEVVPNKKSETFAVEVGGTRVAVRGTVFSVELKDGRAHVDVTRGVVAVGATGQRGNTEGWLLEAPARGNFSLDGAKDGEVQRATGSTEAPAPKTARVDPAGSGAATAPKTKPPKVAAAPVPETPSDETLRKTADQVIAGAQKCFTKHTASAEGTTIRARTKVAITLSPAGSVTSVSFDPPLAPAVQQCAAESVQSIALEPSKNGASVERTVELGD